MQCCGNDRSIKIKKQEKILVITGDVRLQNWLALALESRGFIVSGVEGRQDGLREAIEAVAPDLIIIDPVLPGLHGVSCSVAIRRWCPAPILLLTAANDREDKVRLLELHSPDLLSKPLDLDELISKLRVIIGARKRAATGAGRIGTAKEEPTGNPRADSAIRI